MRLAALASVLCLAPASLHATDAALTKDEVAQLQRSVERCWNTAALSTAAQQTTVTVRVAMSPDRTPVTGGIELIDSNGDKAASQQAFAAARKAILRCGQKGLAVPDGKYELWRELRLTFGTMRIGL